MNTRLLATFSLSLCITGTVAAQGMQRSIMPPPTSIFPASSLQGSVSATGPRWVSKKTTASSNSSSLSSVEKGLIKTGDAVTYAPIGSAIDELEGVAQDHARQMNDIAAGTAAEGQKSVDKAAARYKQNPSNRRLIDKKVADREMGKKVAEAGKQADAAAKKASFLANLGKVLNILDFVSVAAQGAGYLSVGDTTGAAGVMASEISKKTAEGIGALGGGAIIPFVGSVGGAALGNAAWERYVKPEIEKREQALREAEFRREILNKPWLTPKEFIDSKGHVRNLEEDQYVERGSGLVRRRTPEEQAGFERAEYTKWRNQKTWEKINQEHAEGKIDDEQMTELQVSYAGRSLAEPWEPPGFSFVSIHPPANEPQTTNAPPTADELIAGIAPVQLTASGSITETFPTAKIVTTFEFAFWNLGAYSPKHGKAVLKISSSHDEPNVLVGTFSGGPNGTLSFSGDGDTQTFQVSNGTHVIAEMERLVNDGADVESITLTLPLSNPSAFDDWPKALK
ncbi:hypothetical protein GCM10011450_06920 [Advenella faeciporci]|uniref:Uncharacterized protein n=1 Tax=Advenella faeciporci TaxID=797535 RepID=A0A918MWI6_9BURK|nr:hypothetical protein [Advenella faeciporci]GGW79740.1 hypothetical protein GCM10011450_06920 [Advenella faeciporci]